MTISGIVQHGNKLGRELGFPTANLDMGEQSMDPIVSYCVVVLGSERFNALGTYLPHKKTYEVHILDFDRDIYGQELTVYIGETLRENKKFANLTELSEQIQKDVEQARKKLLVKS